MRITVEQAKPVSCLFPLHVHAYVVVLLLVETRGSISTHTAPAVYVHMNASAGWLERYIEAVE